jgi:hypothetical protein
MPSTFNRIVAGFIAGALAVMIFHQGAYWLMKYQFGLPLAAEPWRMNPAVLWPELFRALKMQAPSIPTLVHQSIWGGLWGILFALILHRVPGGIAPIRGLVFGMMFPMLLGSWLLVPLVKGTPMLANAFAKGGFNVLALRNGFLLNGVAFGIGLGLLYPLISGRLSRRS